MLGLEFIVRGEIMYLQVDGKTINAGDILLPGVAVQVLLTGGVYRGSFGIEYPAIGAPGLVIQPFTRNGETLDSELIKVGSGKELKTYPHVWANCNELDGWR